MARGRFLTAQDNENLATVVVLGPGIFEGLFGRQSANPLGETVRISRQNCQVVGVLESKGTSAS